MKNVEIFALQFMQLVFRPIHRGAFCQFPSRWIYYCHCSQSTGKEIGKTHLCAIDGVLPEFLKEIAGLAYLVFVLHVAL